MAEPFEVHAEALQVTVDNYAGIESAASGSFLLPFTHIAASEETYTASDLESTLANYSSQDDVWSTSFANALFISGASSNASDVSTSTSNASTVIFTSSTEGLTNLSSLAPGPYFADISTSSIAVYKAYRTYADYANAFYYGVIPNAEGIYQVTSTSSPETDGRATIAVPSRLYYAPASEEFPLSGVRIGVKDLYDLAGLKTSMGNRAWFRFHPPAEESATCVQYLVDLGAVIIGKTRTSQFANGESPTGDWIDNHDPFNARGDGYQDPSSSSAGAGSASSNYEWVDFNLGSDTGGSIRAPAAYGGVYGNRPSQYIMSLKVCDIRLILGSSY
jgi:hypothetical protein